MMSEVTHELVAIEQGQLEASRDRLPLVENYAESLACPEGLHPVTQTHRHAAQLRLVGGKQMRKQSP